MKNMPIIDDIDIIGVMLLLFPDLSGNGHVIVH
jgi:hypothetical protein